MFFSVFEGVHFSISKGPLKKSNQHLMRSIKKNQIKFSFFFKPNPTPFYAPPPDNFAGFFVSKHKIATFQGEKKLFGGKIFLPLGGFYV